MEARRRDISPVRTAGLLVVAAVWALFLALIGSPEAILFTVPVFLLAAPLAFGRYAGERLIEALRGVAVRRGAEGLSPLRPGESKRCRAGLPPVPDSAAHRLSTPSEPTRSGPAACSDPFPRQSAATDPQSADME